MNDVVWFILYYFLSVSFQLRFHSSHNFITIQTLFMNIWIFKNNSWRRVFSNANLSNLDVLQRNLTTDRDKECILIGYGVTDFENVSTKYQPWWSVLHENVFWYLSRVYIKQYWHFQGVPSKLNYSKSFLEFISHNTDTFRKLLPNSSIHLFERFNGHLIRWNILKEKIPK